MAFGNRMWGNEVVMNYLRTGEYRHWAPVNKVTRWTVSPALANLACEEQSRCIGAPAWRLRLVVLQDPHGKPGCDFFGLNHYARCRPPA